MNITLDEAISILDSWKATGTVLKARLFRSGQSRETQTTVKDIKGSVIILDATGEEITIDLNGADFNGDRRAPLHSSHGVYLICEYRNEDRISFYASRPAQEETEHHESPERRRVP